VKWYSHVSVFYQSITSRASHITGWLTIVVIKNGESKSLTWYIIYLFFVIQEYMYLMIVLQKRADALTIMYLLNSYTRLSEDIIGKQWSTLNYNLIAITIFRSSVCKWQHSFFTHGVVIFKTKFFGRSDETIFEHHWLYISLPRRQLAVVRSINTCNYKLDHKVWVVRYKPHSPEQMIHIKGWAMCNDKIQVACLYLILVERWPFVSNSRMLYLFSHILMDILMKSN
jgi:hypothetical protein